MKRYDFKAHFDPYYGCDVAEPEDCSDGDWVPASVAQALYDALGGMLNIVSDSRGVDGYHLNGDVALWDEFPEIEAAAAALSLADGEE